MCCEGDHVIEYMFFIHRELVIIDQVPGNVGVHDVCSSLMYTVTFSDNM